MRNGRCRATLRRTAAGALRLPGVVNGVTAGVRRAERLVRAATAGGRLSPPAPEGAKLPAGRGTGQRRQPGFVLATVLLIGALAAVFAALVVSAAAADARIGGADRASDRAWALTAAGVAEALERLSWTDAGSAPPLAPAAFTTSLDGGSYLLTLTRRAPAPGGPAWPRFFDITVSGRSGRGRAVRAAAAAVAPIALPRGLAVAGQIDCLAPLTLDGCGAYAGGDVHGREFITVASDSSPLPPSDNAFPELFPQAGVHAGGRIFAEGAEEHRSGGGPPEDGDSCTGAPPPVACHRLPDAGRLGALAAHAADPGAALQGDCLDLSAAAPLCSPLGGVVVIKTNGRALRLTGWRPPTTPRLTVVVIGDAVLAPSDAGAGVCLSGVLVVTGRLLVETPALINGSLGAASLLVRAPLVVYLSASWTDSPPPGALTAWTI